MKTKTVDIPALVAAAKAAAVDPSKRFPGFVATVEIVQALAEATPAFAGRLVVMKDSKGYHYATTTSKYTARMTGKEMARHILNQLVREELEAVAAAEARTAEIIAESIKSTDAFWAAVNTTTDLSTKTAHAGSPFKVTAMGALVWHGKSVSPGSHILVTMLRRMVILEEVAQLYHAFATLSKGGTWRG